MGSRFPATKKAQRRLDHLLHARTQEALRERNERFAAEHGGDSDEWLLRYLQAQARELRMEPFPCEVIGNKLIIERFGDWNSALEAAGLPPVRIDMQPKFQDTTLYKEEFKRQVRLHQQEKDEAMKKRHRAKLELDRAKREESALRIKQDLAWGGEHKDDSDEELLAYVRDCAEKLGHTPYRREVEGGAYIKERFGSWPLVLTLADLKLPQDMRPPKAKEIEGYRRCKT